MRQRPSSKFLRDLPTIDPLADEPQGAEATQTSDAKKESDEKMPVFSDDDDEFDFSDVSTFSEEEAEDFTDSKKKSFYFPFLGEFTILNFTENFRFSYFAVPGYVKDHNQKVKKGILKLPVISEKKNEKTKPRQPKEKKRNNLLKRIEKLNQMGTE
uniref:uncharacterized protein LOC113475294 n=1 Tax=Ciona intestinalis TaxID=7719 RepID=UPI000EF5144F|nr:uncharacterized protein LOC113475294 [Ciona intestinalis]|eukprot:XP_026695120.1 uncharacterized protein LOC113475294 [Ciona intestinalis]